MFKKPLKLFCTPSPINSTVNSLPFHFKPECLSTWGGPVVIRNALLDQTSRQPSPVSISNSSALSDNLSLQIWSYSTLERQNNLLYSISLRFLANLGSHCGKRLLYILYFACSLHIAFYLLTSLARCWCVGDLPSRNSNSSLP